MPPELLVPGVFCKEDAVPTPQADIYAFGLVIYQVCELVYGIGHLMRAFSRSLRDGPHLMLFGNQQLGTT